MVSLSQSPVPNLGKGMALPCPYDKSICIRIFVKWYHYPNPQSPTKWL
ncbi:hypothetical protein [Nostoc sp.]